MRALLLPLMACVLGCGSAPTPPPASAPAARNDPAAFREPPQPPISEPEPTQPEPSHQSAPEPSTETAVPSAAPLPADTTVLVVGSSTAAALGHDLKRELGARGVRCILRNKDASYIPEWAGDRLRLRDYIREYNPDLVIVSLGGNEVAMPDPSVRAEPIRKIVEIIGNRPCVWVGTPRWKGLPHTGILDVIQQNIAPCLFVDSDLIAPNLIPWVDGIHPTIPERRRWARRMLQWLEYNRDPGGERPWDFKKTPIIPPEP